MSDDDQPEIPPEALERAREGVCRLHCIGPELIKYAWRGIGVHQPESADALLGLQKVEVRWMRTTSLTPVWTQATIVGGGEAPAFTAVAIRYWIDGVPGFRSVVYRVGLHGYFDVPTGDDSHIPLFH